VILETRNSIWRGRAGWLLLLFCLLLPAGVGAAEPETVRLRLKWLHQFQFAGIYAAIEQGYYREAGLEVQLQEAQAHESAVEAVLRGEADFGLHGADLVVERARGAPVTALAVIMQHSPMVLLCRRDSGIEHVHDIKGKRLLLGPDAAELLAYLKSEGLPAPQGLTLQSFDLHALLSGAVDAMPGYSTDETWLLEQRHFAYNAFSPRAAGLDFYGDTLFTHEDVLQRRPGVARAFTDATLRGWHYALAHRVELVELILARYSTRHSREHLLFEAEQTRRLMTPELVAIGHMQEGRWRHIADSFAELGMMPRDFSLAGFLPRDPAVELQLQARRLTLALLGGLLALLLAAYVLWLNRSLRREARERQAAESHLRASEEQARALLESAPFPILIIHQLDGTIRYLNRRCAEHFGVRREDIRGRPVLDFYAHPADRERLLEDVARYGLVQDRELELRNHRGESFWGLVSCIRIEYEGEAAYFATLIDISERKTMELELRRLARTDTLTGLANRAHGLDRLTEEIDRARRHGHPLALLALDLDYFKQINDGYGHAAGDEALRRFARLLLSCLRNHDFAGRMGGEEFLAVLPVTDLAAAQQVAERIRRTVEQRPVTLPDGRTIRMTVSIGVAVLDGPMEAGTLLRQADQALYEAKHAGRNAVRVTEDRGQKSEDRRTED